MTLRIIRLLLVAGVALLYTLVVFNNLTDYGSNYEFVRHVMMMDTTFPGNRGMWRAIQAPILHTAFYISIIAWETVTTFLCWWGAARMARALSGTAAEFHKSKQIAIAALGLGLMQWLVAFLAFGAEWFLMWQSKEWNGQEAAQRMFTVLGIVLLIVAQPETDAQP